MPRRSSPASFTASPSSESATAPEAASVGIGASSSPRRPLVMVAIGRTRQAPVLVARLWMYSTTVGWSIGGIVLGMQATAVNPPCTAAAVPDAISSLCVCPGSRRCTCMSTKPGATRRLRASMTRWRPPGEMLASIAAIRPSASSTSASRSTPVAGSMTRPPWITKPMSFPQLPSLRGAKRRSNLGLNVRLLRCARNDRLSVWRLATSRDDGERRIRGNLSNAFPCSRVPALRPELAKRAWGFPSFVCVERPQQHREPHSNPVGHLGLDRRARAVRRVGRDLHTKVHRPRVQQQRIRPGVGQRPCGHAVVTRVLGQGRYVPMLLPFQLHAQSHHNVGAGETLFERRGHTQRRRRKREEGRGKRGRDPSFFLLPSSLFPGPVQQQGRRPHQGNGGSKLGKTPYC